MEDPENGPDTHVADQLQVTGSLAMAVDGLRVDDRCGPGGGEAGTG
jgi:hypothetical protein